MALTSVMPTSEMPSCFFVANLCNLDPAVVEEHKRWVEATCVERALRNRDGGPVALRLSEAAANTSRQHHSLLRTTRSHWEMPLRKLGAGWLSPMARRLWTANAKYFARTIRPKPMCHRGWRQLGLTARISSHWDCFSLSVLARDASRRDLGL